MATYTFLTTGTVSATDLEQIIALTQAGTLAWRPDDHYTAFIGGPAQASLQDNRTALADAVGANLHGLRLGYVPSTHHWHYLRLVDTAGRQHYVEAEPQPPLADLCDELYRLVQKAVRLGGTLGSVHDAEHYCGSCELPTPHRTLCDRPYGLAGTIMGGSERLVCTVCEYSQSLATTGR